MDGYECSVSNCDKRKKFRGSSMCSMHYTRMRRHGSAHQTMHEVRREKPEIKGETCHIIKKGYKIILDTSNIALFITSSWSVDSSGYATNGKVRLHTAVMGKKGSFIIDHINGNRLDNRLSNLRFVTSSQNAINRKQHYNNKSGYKGVYPWKRDSNWVVKVGKPGGGYVFGGYFNDKKEAAIMYNKIALRINGEYAWLNKVE